MSMIQKFARVNQLLWLLLLVLALGFFISLLFSWQQNWRTEAKISIKETPLPILAMTKVTWPPRNPFDLSGKTWHGSAQPRRQISQSRPLASGNVLGVFRLGDIGGVMTSSGVVVPGEAMEGGVVTTNEEGKIVVEKNGVATEIGVNQERDQRKATVPLSIE